jgi:hypothetical protein
MFGPYASLMTEEQIQEFRDSMQEQANKQRRVNRER